MPAFPVYAGKMLAFPRSKMYIYNTMTRKKELFTPIEENKVSMYVCGPTVYDYFHIGNARPFLFFDVVRNYFKYLGYEITYIQNITDIDDKIIARANEEKVDYKEITKKYIGAYLNDLKALGIEAADVNPLATAFLDKMIDLIESLIKKGFAYHVNGDVYFSVSKYKEYGKLSGKNLDDLQAGARIEANQQKLNPFDFTLWKKAKEGEPAWDSPWGQGRPGWHTECVAMSKCYLGETFDIHGGGVDLVFPHHENEIAQAEAIAGKPLANYWMHNGFLNIEGNKMSKSLDNFFTAREVLKVYDADVIRFFFLSKHYRSPIDYNKEILEEAKTAFSRFYEVFRKYPVKMENVNNAEIRMQNAEMSRKQKMENGESIMDNNPLSIIHYPLSIDKGGHNESLKQDFLDAMNDDFNTAKAIACLFDIAKVVFNQDIDENTQKEAAMLLYELGSVLGFFKDISEKMSKNIDDKAERLVLFLIEIRNQAKIDKNYALADKIRNELKSMGIELRDTANGTEWTI